MDKLTDLKTCHHLSGEYRGIKFNIYRQPPYFSGEHEQNVWAEILLVPENIPDLELRKTFFVPASISTLGYPYWENPFRNWYKLRADVYKIRQLYGTDMLVAEISWDYMHLHSPYSVTAEEVCSDITASIDELFVNLHMHIRCPYCSKYGDPTAWIDPGFGKWTPIHPECNQKRIDELAKDGKDAFANPINPEE